MIKHQIWFLILIAVLPMDVKAGNCTAPAAIPGAMERFASGGYKLCNGSTSSWESIDLVTTGVACATNNAIEYDPALQKQKVCDAGTWKTFGCDGACVSLGACALNGAKQYSVADNGLIWCDGTNWRKTKTVVVSGSWVSRGLEFDIGPNENTCGYPSPANQICSPVGSTCYIRSGNFSEPFDCSNGDLGGGDA